MPPFALLFCVLVDIPLNLSGTEELTSTRLARIFGQQALNELYLKGRTTLKANPQQVALLA
ncbi:hypothetical protein E0686_14430 [Deinococcus sp. S9]|nr:hypothetical protein E0686_14430 [Deinococcus sp. S9]